MRFSVTQGAIIKDTRRLLWDLDFDVPERATTVVLGPSGTGKSMLLRVLGGAPLPGGWALEGSWRCDSTDVFEAAGRYWVPQSRRETAEHASIRERAVGLRGVFQSGASAILMDEPTRGLALDLDDELASELRQHTDRGGTALVVTHHLGFARAIADRVLLLINHTVEYEGPAEPFFERPPSELAQRFLEQGNAWPAPKPLEPPSHFNWLEPGKIAGMAEPGLVGDVEDELGGIALAGIDVLVSLTEQPLPFQLLRSFGIEGRHLPIRDMGVPAVGPLLRTLSGIQRSIDSGLGVAVHCRAGLGRTGTVLAAYLLYRGSTAEEAIERVRSVGSGYIQSRAQLDFLQRFAEDVGR